jgi:hypothetical protein
MSDSEFLLWYINKIYLFTGSEIKYKYLVDDEPLSIYEVNENIKYSLNITDSTNKSFNILKKWYDDLKYLATEDVIDFIKFKYKVSLGPTNWEITNFSGKKVTIEDIYIGLRGKYDEKFIKNIVNHWFENEIIKVSEDMILRFN